MYFVATTDCRSTPAAWGRSDRVANNYTELVPARCPAAVVALPWLPAKNRSSGAPHQRAYFPVSEKGRLAAIADQNLDVRFHEHLTVAGVSSSFQFGPEHKKTRRVLTAIREKLYAWAMSLFTSPILKRQCHFTKGLSSSLVAFCMKAATQKSSRRNGFGLRHRAISVEQERRHAPEPPKC